VTSSHSLLYTRRHLDCHYFQSALPAPPPLETNLQMRTDLCGTLAQKIANFFTYLFFLPTYPVLLFLLLLGAVPPNPSAKCTTVQYIESWVYTVDVQSSASLVIDTSL